MQGFSTLQYIAVFPTLIAPLLVVGEPDAEKNRLLEHLFGRVRGAVSFPAPNYADNRKGTKVFQPWA